MRALCILGEGTVTWSVARGNSYDAADFRTDFDQTLVPSFHRQQASHSSFFRLMTDLMASLHPSILAPEDIYPAYGGTDWNISVPKSADMTLPPDEHPWEFERTKEIEEWTKEA